ncbi:hypothetical protein EV178_001472 [Coemansia sp. RSA 1646]|nr:hypothetical protein EV178_001472 [Coemansia sp. RSA 1646]
MHRELMGKTSYIARAKGAGDFTPYEQQPMSKERQRYIRSVCIRILAYPLIPIITQIWVVAANMAPKAPMWLYVMANIVPATQGILNFLAFTANPAWDQFRGKLLKRYNTVREKRAAAAATSKETDSGFSRLVEEGTIYICFEMQFETAGDAKDPLSKQSETNKHRPSSTLSAKVLLALIREQVKLNFGDSGAGRILGGLQLIPLLADPLNPN